MKYKKAFAMFTLVGCVGAPVLANQAEAMTRQQATELNRAVNIRNAQIAFENAVMEKYNNGLQAYRNGNYQQCIETLSNNYVRNKFQNRKDYNMAMGDSYFNLKQFNATISYLSRAEQQGAGNYQVLQRDMGLSYFELGNAQGAAAYLQRLSSQSNMPAEFWYKLAIAYHQLNNENMEFTTITKLVNLYPSFNADSYIRLGEIYLSHDQTKNALQNFMAGLKYFPDDASLLYGAGHVLYLNGDFENAISYLLKSNDVRPDNLDTLYDLGGAYLQIDDLDKASSVADIMMKLAPKDNRTIDLYKAVQQKIMQKQMEQQMQQDMINQDIQNQQQAAEQASADQVAAVPMG